MMFNKTNVLWNSRIAGLLQKAGYMQMMPLQNKVIPLILKGKDIAVEAGEKTGKTAAFILPLLEKLDRNKAGIKALVLTAAFENAKKITREFKKFLRHSQSPLEIALLGNVKGERAEFRTLSRKPDIVVGPTERVIDHIRRGNMSFDELRFVVIESTDHPHHEGFQPDIHFILAKLSPGYQTILFTPPPFSSIESVLALLKRPVLINESDWKGGSQAGTCSYFIIRPDQIEDKQRLLIQLVITRKIESLLLICNDEKLIPVLAAFLNDSGLTAYGLAKNVKTEEFQNLLKSFHAHNFNALVAPAARIDNPESVRASHVIYFDMPEKYEPSLKQIPVFVRNVREVYLFISAEFTAELQKNEELIKLSMNSEVFPKDEEVMKNYLEIMLKKIKEEEDPAELNQIKKIIVKHIPIFRRSFVLAYLFKELYDKKIQKKSPATTTLFLSAGKNRRIFPADIIHFFTSELKIKEAEIKEVKILDNYSFIEISSVYAAKAISQLNGKDFKGKRLSINYARKKERRPQKTREFPAKRKPAR
jgi:ATP-dependent RNA helicase DeaD